MDKRQNFVDPVIYIVWLKIAPVLQFTYVRGGIIKTPPPQKELYEQKNGGRRDERRGGQLRSRAPFKTTGL